MIPSHMTTNTHYIKANPLSFLTMKSSKWSFYIQVPPHALTKNVPHTVEKRGKARNSL